MTEHRNAGAIHAIAVAAALADLLRIAVLFTGGLVNGFLVIVALGLAFGVHGTALKLLHRNEEPALLIPQKNVVGHAVRVCAFSIVFVLEGNEHLAGAVNGSHPPLGVLGVHQRAPVWQGAGAAVEIAGIDGAVALHIHFVELAIENMGGSVLDHAIDAMGKGRHGIKGEPEDVIQTGIQQTLLAALLGKNATIEFYKAKTANPPVYAVIDEISLRFQIPIDKAVLAALFRDIEGSHLIVTAHFRKIRELERFAENHTLILK